MRPEHTFVGEVVTQAQHEVGWLALLLDQPLYNFALVDEAWTDFKIGFACHNLNLPFLGHRSLEMFLALASLEGTIFRISAAVMPRQSNLLPLNE
jgi:hypothetical protein